MVIYIKWKGQTHTYSYLHVRPFLMCLLSLLACSLFYTAHLWLSTPSLHLFGIISLLGRGGGWYRHRL